MLELEEQNRQENFAGTEEIQAEEKSEKQGA